MTSSYSTPSQDGLDGRDFLNLLRRRGWILLACVILIPLAVYQLTASRPKVFEATTILQAEGGVDGTDLGADFGAPQANIQAVASFVATTAVGTEAARRLRLPASEVIGAARGAADEDTGFLTISATGSTPKRAADIANAYAAALNATRAARGTERINDAIATVQSNLRETPRDNVAQRTQLQTQLQRLRTLQAAQAQNVEVLQPAAGARQIAPHPRRNATVAILLALLVGAGLILLTERLDRRLRKPEDAEGLSGLPFLGTVPREAFTGDKDDPEVPEAFQTLRNSLTYFNVDEELRTLVVSSSLQGEGKTTVAANLAIAYAAFGKRVIVVDTDLRKPDLAQRLGFTDHTGLSDVLAGNTALHDSLIDVAPFGHGLRLLPAGPVPPNPSALIGTLRMASLLDELAEDADIVIIDSTPLLMVSDAFPLLEKVSGVVLLARLDKTPVDAIQRSTEIMASAGARALGVVVTGLKRSRLTGYGYGYGYGYGRQQAGSAAPGAEAAGHGPTVQP